MLNYNKNRDDTQSVLNNVSTYFRIISKYCEKVDCFISGFYGYEIGYIHSLIFSAFFNLEENVVTAMQEHSSFL